MVMSIVMAITRWSPAGYRASINGCTDIDTTPDAIIAVISDHAFTRHQYQRRISTSPVPDPSASRSFQAPSTVPNCHATRAEARNRKMVVQRDTHT